MDFSLDFLSPILSRVPLFQIKQILSICIEERDIRFVEIEYFGSKFTVTNFAIIRIPPIRDDQDIKAVIKETLRNTYVKGGFKAKHVFVTLINATVFFRKISLPRIPKSELEKAMFWEASEHIPFSMESSYFDWQAVGEGGVKDGAKQDQYIIAACDRGIIDTLDSFMSEIGLRLTLVGLPSFSLFNIVKSFKAFPVENYFSILDIGTNRTNIIIFKDRKIKFAREILIGYDTLDEYLFSEDSSLREKLGGRYLDVIKSQYSFTDPHVLNTEIVPGVSNHHISSSINMYFDRMFSEITRSFDFFKKEEDLDIKSIFICGIGTRIADIKERFENRFHLPIHFIEKDESILFDKKLNKEAFHVNFKHLLLAIGCAVGKFDQINLLPKKFDKVIQQKVASVILCVLFVFSFLSLTIIGGIKKKAVRDLEYQIEAEERKIKNTVPQVELLQNNTEDFKKKINTIRSIVKNQRDFSILFREISYLVPPYIVLNEIEYENDILALEGIVFDDPNGTLSRESVLVDFVLALSSSELIDSAELEFSKADPLPHRINSIFRINCRVKNRYDLMLTVGDEG